MNTFLFLINDSHHCSYSGLEGQKETAPPPSDARRHSLNTLPGRRGNCLRLHVLQVDSVVERQRPSSSSESRACGRPRQDAVHAMFLFIDRHDTVVLLEPVRSVRARPSRIFVGSGASRTSCDLSYPVMRVYIPVYIVVSSFPSLSIIFFNPFILSSSSRPPSVGGRSLPSSLTCVWLFCLFFTQSAL